MDSEFVKWFATLGVGGVLAGFMFVFYRKDVRQFTDLWKTQSEQLMLVVRENTVAITKNTATIDSLHSRNDSIEETLRLLGLESPHRDPDRGQRRTADTVPSPVRIVPID